MKHSNREYNKKKFEELMIGFTDAYDKYLSERLEEIEKAKAVEEFDILVDSRLTKEKFFVEYALDNGLVFERTGHWVCGDDDQDYWRCSECGLPVMAADDWCDPYEAEIEYCEKCGTRMIKPEKK